MNSPNEPLISEGGQEIICDHEVNNIIKNNMKKILSSGMTQAAIHFSQFLSN